jgi:hypothetical protein
MAIDVVPPDHCAAETVWLCDDRAIRYDHPFVGNEDAATPTTGLPIRIRHCVPVRIGTALSKFAL